MPSDATPWILKLYMVSPLVRLSQLLYLGDEQVLGLGAGETLQLSFCCRQTCSSCTRQYECADVLDGFWGPGNGCWRIHTSSETVPGQIFTSINFRSLGRFIQVANIVKIFTPRQ